MPTLLLIGAYSLPVAIILPTDITGFTSRRARDSLPGNRSRVTDRL